MECSGTTVRGITSDIEFEWRHDNSTVNATSVPTIVMNNLVVYRVSYTISQLSTSDDNERYNCRLTVCSSPQATDTEPVILDVTGEYFSCVCPFVLYELVHHFLSLGKDYNYYSYVPLKVGSYIV